MEREFAESLVGMLLQRKVSRLSYSVATSQDPRGSTSALVVLEGGYDIEYSKLKVEFFES